MIPIYASAGVGEIELGEWQELWLCLFSHLWLTQLNSLQRLLISLSGGYNSQRYLSHGRISIIGHRIYTQDRDTACVAIPISAFSLEGGQKLLDSISRAKDWRFQGLPQGPEG